MTLRFKLAALVLASAMSIPLVSIADSGPADLPSTPKDNPFNKAVPVKVDARTGVDAEEVARIVAVELEKAMMRKAMEMDDFSVDGQVASPGVEGEIGPEEVLNTMDYIGVVNGRHIYKDQNEGCYVYEDETVSLGGEAINSRCYNRALNRLRNAPEELANDGSGDGSPTDQ